MEKRYQVFISSTYADLKEERKHVIQTVMELDCIPAGMELFPAADEEQFEFIKRVIDDCDYYLLIIGGRYGSTTEEGISYTEKEYDYAVTQGLKVIALLHENPDDIPLGKSEKDPALRERLQQFRDKVAADRLVKFWKSAEELPGLVSLSLSKTIKMFPAVGWIRADRVASEEILEEINDLRKQNTKLSIAISELSAEPQQEVSNLAGMDELFEVHGRYNKEGYGMRDWEVKATWREIFGLISPYLVKHPNEEYVKSILASALFKKSIYYGRSENLNDQDFQTVSVQLKALGLVNMNYSKTVQGGMALFWSATPAGERLMLDIRTIRSANIPNA
ncbi:DUF4062 domain-containing protein [Sedimenticola selenatireducens]|uniref:DUF4062 domain-containing protein n=1 Tax=Sedimenticola selenatireducens TaxID=191960 RepID=A0A2N6CT02_9GAMM|nr:DUF4062 domain-containing protein [Sedimenticola selenatireducens]PLX60243.1 MAG: hypothetical protein C0630_16545 [Sedimenticola selenatireducens]